MQMNLAAPRLILARHGIWIAFYVLALVASILPATGWLTSIPGDLGDARFNSVILEHVFQRLTGQVGSLWSPPFFYPFEGTLAFSDNHIGSVASYALARLLGLSRESAYLAWFILGSSLNYFAMYYALRKLRFSRLASAFGAFVFAVGLPAIPKNGHAQLVHRFATPLAMLCFWRFFQQGRALDIFWMIFWGAWQFFCSIYLGVFLVYLLVVSFLGWFWFGRRFFSQWIARLLASWKRLSAFSRYVVPALAMILGTGMAFMLHRYMYIGSSYGFERSLAEIDSMLPRLQSYMHAPGSLLYSSLTRGISIPMGHEQQMFIGFFAGFFLLVGAISVLKAPGHKFGQVCLFSIVFLVAGTLYINGLSFYHLLLKLPGVSSVRAVARIVLTMLFPVAVLVAVAIDYFASVAKQKFALKGLLILGGLVIVGGFVEVFFFHYDFTPISAWRNRQERIRPLMPASYSADSVLYLAGNGLEPNLIFEIDGMILAQDLGLRTLNGYSGNEPPLGWGAGGQKAACVGYVHRLKAYEEFKRSRGQVVDLDKVANRVLVLMPSECSRLVDVTDSLSVDVAQRVKLAAVLLENRSVSVRIENGAESTFSSITRKGPVRLSWRIIPDNKGTHPEVGWDARLDFQTSLLRGETTQIVFVPVLPVSSGRYLLQVSLVQEGVVWLHDLGMKVAEVGFVIE